MDELIAAHRGAIPAAHWEVIGPFISAVMADLKPPTVRQAKNYFTAVTAHVHWCWQTLGMELDRQQIFQLDVIARFIDGGCGRFAASTRSSYRGRLTNVSRVVVVGPGRPLPLRPYRANRNASPPYTSEEVARLAFWARHQRTEYRSVNATVLLALAFGAGLTPAEVIALRARDVQADSEGVLLTIEGKRPRVVPVLARWEGIIADLATASLRPDQYLFGTKRVLAGAPNLVSHFASQCTHPPVHLVPQRMRCTWIVGHLAAGVPPQAILEASGIAHPGGLARYAEYVPHLTSANVREMLRQASAVASVEVQR